MFTESCTPRRFDELLSRSSTSGAEWMRATLAFKGPFQGELTVDVPEPLALELLASCVGISSPGEENLPSVEDAVGELANMVCGTWLTKNHGAQKFDLKAAARRSRGREQPAASVGVHRGLRERLMGLNDQPVRVRWRSTRRSRA